ncbi:MAG TPA: hypothetical protein VLS93_05115 [Anaeromyxobacteraceae bacterium]|nr:hypothetical protein [Anaeromyxobacteraceae bacterium]
MTEAHGNQPAHAPTEEDRISTGPVLWVGAGSLVVFFLASLATTSYLHLREGQSPPPPVPAEVGQSKIGLVEQQLFEVSLRGEQQRKTQRERLESWGWADRERGTLHMPIERAMELTAEGVRPPPGPPPAPPPLTIGG